MVIEISKSSSLQSKMAALNYFSVVILIRQLERHVSYNISGSHFIYVHSYEYNTLIKEVTCPVSGWNE